MSQQGQGAATVFKEEGFERLFRENLAIFKGGRHRCPCYPHFDLTAGDGMNGPLAGSPLVWKAVAGEMGVESWRAWFVERNAQRAEVLAGRAELADARCVVENADHREFIRRIPGILDGLGLNREHAIGSVVVDPNGHDDMPLADLAWLAGSCSKLDYILNWNAAAMKRWLVYLLNRNDPRAAKKIRLNDGIARLGKRFWLIREPRDFWQWSIAFGTNYERREYHRLGFYDVRSQHGMHIVDRLSHTEKERAGRYQGTLFP